jgi:hypothetical protein
LGLLYRAMGKTAEAKAEYDKSKSLNETADEDLIKVLSKMPLRDNASQSTVPAPANQ